MGKTNQQIDSNRLKEPDDPVLMMLGAGRQLWEQESGDAFVKRLRSETQRAPRYGSDDARSR